MPADPHASCPDEDQANVADNEDPVAGFGDLIQYDQVPETINDDDAPLEETEDEDGAMPLLRPSDFSPNEHRVDRVCSPCRATFDIGSIDDAVDDEDFHPSSTAKEMGSLLEGQKPDK